MPEPQANYEDRQTPRPVRKWLVRTTLFLLVILACVVLVWIVSGKPSVDEQIEAFDAARSIPDDENAAVIYRQLWETNLGRAVRPSFTRRYTYGLITHRLWSSKDRPEAAQWIQSHQDTRSMLKQACERAKCWLPISTDRRVSKKLRDSVEVMREWAELLIAAGNNDMAEGRIDAGLEKYLCAVQMAKHLYQMPLTRNLWEGREIEELALARINAFIVEGDASEEHIGIVKVALPPMEDNWSRYWPEILEMESLLERLYSNQEGILTRLESRLLSEDVADDETVYHLEYHRLVARRRGARIILGLKRYQIKEGSWPHGLDDVKSLVPAEAFVDPLNGGDFVYRLTDENFSLYSKGTDNVDGKGSVKTDWLIWPLKGRWPW
ncbi:MAG: hypothetical protein ACYS29_11235 [Planctomycetota bacterium]|jgi:hypothetical protein